ncbi:hypothetical protein PR048_026779 [Dryococelus australis]|uniref:Uncharacterized protein n=1 Tax=Dryococelus australis TaxID=614101 RepID=A0ABQ9GMB3_9NEOP|nr:hypothetical protein PR048_026779 [Dryococelus australis]
MQQIYSWTPSQLLTRDLWDDEADTPIYKASPSTSISAVLHTFGRLQKVEAVLNAQPLCPLSFDTYNLSALTP